MAGFLRERAVVVGHDDLVGAPFRDALSGAYDRWLAELLPPRTGYALVAVGGLGRREVTEFSDLDLVLLHDGARADVAQTADAIWYRVWDAKIKLDHSVRTVREALDVAGEDLRAGLGLLDARHIAGDPDLTRDLVDGIRTQWRTEGRRRLAELLVAQEQRWSSSGELAFLLEPNLKDGRGGLRDVHALHAVAAVQAVDVPMHKVRPAYRTLLDVRGELHRVARRPIDLLLLEEQDAVAERLSYADADALARAVSAAGRTVDYVSAQVRRGMVQWLEISSNGSRAGRAGRGARAARAGGLLRRSGGPTAVQQAGRRPLAEDVVEQGGEVVLAFDADPATDPTLVLRVAAAAAQAELPINPYALDRLAAGAALPEAWPDQARDALVTLLAAGAPAVPVLEALDQAGILVRLLPEWEHVRFRTQRNPVHTYTVDRHLVQTAVHAAGMTRRVSRPDLLLVGALLHDIGKGFPGDHTEVGMTVMSDMAPRLGFVDADVATLVAMVEHHLLLPDMATRRDPDDPATTAAVARAVGGSSELLMLLAALAEADGLATGPGAWSDWKAGLVRALVRRVRAVIAGDPVPQGPSVTPAQAALAAGGDVAVRIEGPEVTVVAPDQPGLLSRVAGVLALHKLDVHSATSTAVPHEPSPDGAAADPGRAVAVLVFQVASRFGGQPDPALVRSDVLRALAGDLSLTESLGRREAAYGRGPARATRVVHPDPQAVWVDGEATGAALLEVRCEDRIGLLHRLTSELERFGLDIVSARVSTLGTAAVDVFYLRDATGAPVPDGAVRDSVASALVAAAASGVR